MQVDFIDDIIAIIPYKHLLHLSFGILTKTHLLLMDGV